MEVASNQSVSEELRSDTVFEELPFHGLEAVSSVGVVEEDTFVDSWEEESSDDSDKEGDETEVEEEENLISSSIEPPKERESKTNVKSQKQVMKRETREHEVLETPLVSFQAVSKPKEARVDNDDEHGRSDEEEVAEENLEPLKSSVSSSDEERIDRIRRLELKLLGREKLLGGGADSDKPEAKTGGRVEGETKKKKKKKVLVKGKKSSTIEIPGSSKRLKKHAAIFVVKKKVTMVDFFFT